jgi:flavin reductase (DIM6/NTAB) family NADH-FMN oxidoreductase RutF
MVSVIGEAAFDDAWGGRAAALGQLRSGRARASHLRAVHTGAGSLALGQEPDTGATEVLVAAFRATMRRVVGGVCVVTADVGGMPHGTTVSAFFSLSMRPPMMAVSLDNTSNLLAGIRVGQAAGINILAAGQADLALRFARKSDDKLAGVAWTSDHGSPRLAGVHAWVAVRVGRAVPGGDHTLLLCEVLASTPAEAPAPLTYHEGDFGTHVTP